MNTEGQISYPSEVPSAPAGVGLVLLIALAGAACFWGLDAGPPLSDHEAIVPQCARQIRQTGNWLIPHFNNVPFIRKTPLQFWVVAATSYIVDPADLDPPVSPVAARLPSAVAGLLTVLVVYWLGRSIYDHRTALVAGAITACSGGMMFFAHNAQTEMLLTFLIAASMACFYQATTSCGPKKRYWVGFYVCFGLAMLAKAPLPLALVGLALFVYWFVTIPLQQALELGSARSRSVWLTTFGEIFDQVKRVRDLWLLPGIIIFLALVLPWPIYVYCTIDNAVELWRTEFIDRYIGLLKHSKPAWYYIPILFAMVVPFCLSLPEAIVGVFRERYKQDRPGMLFALTWVLVQITFLSTSSFKRPHYLLPVLPGVCLLLAPVIDRLFLRAITLNATRVRVALIAICSAIVVASPFGVWAAAKEDPDVVWAVAPALVLLLAGVGAVCYLFWRQRRLASLLALCVMSVSVFAWTWSSLGRSDVGKSELKMAEAMKRLSIGSNDRITRAVGRPDARISYYLGVNVNPLYSPLEMATRRRGRLEVPLEILIEGAARVADRLNSDQEEYFIFEAKELDMLQFLSPIEYREVLRVETEDDNPDKAIILITNTWNTGEEEDLKAPTPTSSPTTQPSEEQEPVSAQQEGAG